MIPFSGTVENVSKTMAVIEMPFDPVKAKLLNVLG
jgi:hypothetical protein